MNDRNDWIREISNVEGLDITDDLKKVIAIARQAAKIVLAHYQQQLEITIKDNDQFNYLTQADQESNQYIQAELKKYFPGDKLLLEESEDRPSSYDGRVWMVDPLDGTKEFINGGKNFSVMIGLCVDGLPYLGCVVRPVNGDIYFAENSKGAHKVTNRGDCTRLHVNDISELSQARAIISVAHGELRPAEKLLAELPVKNTIPGASLGLRVTDIAEGKAEFFVNTNMRACKWDSCAPQVILEESGGLITDIFGNRLDYMQTDYHWKNSFVGTNAAIHQKVIESIKGIEDLLS